jgi:hypothetical protein
MKKVLFYFIISIVSPLFTLGQPVVSSDCNKVKDGTFYFYPADTQQGVHVLRQGSLQTEIDLKTNDTSFWKVNWLDDCTFRVEFIRKSQPLTSYEKNFFNSHTVVYNILAISKDYYLFRLGLDSISNADSKTDTLWLKAR